MKKTLLIAGLAGLVALLFAALGTSTLSIAPAFNLRLIEPVICPQGEKLEYRELGQFTFTDAEGTHKRANISMSCVSADGAREEGKGTSVISTLMGMYFLICFVPLFVSGVLFRGWILRRYKGTPKLN
jgi:hypothetical protein